MAAIQDTNQLSSFVKEVLEKGKSKYRSNLGIGSPKYVESMKMFENFTKIANGLCQEVQTEDEFEKLEHHIVEIHDCCP